MLKWLRLILLGPFVVLMALVAMGLVCFINWLLLKSRDDLDRLLKWIEDRDKACVLVAVFWGVLVCWPLWCQTCPVPSVLVGKADFNFDGLPDLACQNRTTGAVTVILAAPVNPPAVLGTITVTASNPWKLIALIPDAFYWLPALLWEGPNGQLQVWYLQLRGAPGAQTLGIVNAVNVGTTQ